MVEVGVLCLGIALGWALAGWIARAEIEQRERIWRSRVMAMHPATRPLSIAMTDDDTGGTHVEAVEMSVN